VPLDHNDPRNGSITLFGRIVSRNTPAVIRGLDEDGDLKKPWLLYLEGGPGFGNRMPQDSPLVRENLHEPYRILLLDYRGTGLSTPVSAATIPGEAPAEKAAYLRLLRQDSIVRDLEAVRQCLTKDSPPPLKKWSLWGQSFGGFVSLTYLSYFPGSLREVFMTGGLAPVGVMPTVVYDATFMRVRERNDSFYKKFPDCVQTVHEIVQFLLSQPGGKIPLPAGGYLTPQRFLTLGINFGNHGGLDIVRAIITKTKLDIDSFGSLSRNTLALYEMDTSFDTNIIYAILHEAIYCDGPGPDMASNWAAFQAGAKTQHFGWVQNGPASLASADASPAEPLYFSGEMIFPFHFETYPELMALQAVADELAAYEDWPHLYDQAQLARNTVPVFAASFVDDMYVDFELSMQTARKVKGIKVFSTNAMYHNAVRARSGDVIKELLRLRDDPID